MVVKTERERQRERERERPLDPTEPGVIASPENMLVKQKSKVATV